MAVDSAQRASATMIERVEFGAVRLSRMMGLPFSLVASEEEHTELAGHRVHKARLIFKHRRDDAAFALTMVHAANGP